MENSTDSLPAKIVFFIVIGALVFFAYASFAKNIRTTRQYVREDRVELIKRACRHNFHKKRRVERCIERNVARLNYRGRAL